MLNIQTTEITCTMQNNASCDNQPKWVRVRC